MTKGRSRQAAGRSCGLVWLFLLLAVWALGAAGPNLVPMGNLGLNGPPGFQVTVFADGRRVPNPAAITLDAWGRVVVGGPGYLYVLQDADTNGVVEAVLPFATFSGTATALAVEGSGLLAVVDNTLYRYRDNDQNGVADGPPERLLKFKGPANAWRSLRRGPDGWWYLLCGAGEGPELGFVPLDSSPVVAPEGGALYRFSPDWREYEILAHGFHSPAGLSCNRLGDWFTADGETTADYLTPWYAPAQVHQILFSGHHGWRSGRAMQPSTGRARPGFYADTVAPITDLGRGRPSDVVVYQHYPFPEPFHEGLLVADWVYGRVFFIPLEVDGAGYAGRPELFLEAADQSGFAPTALAVAPDGSLLVASGRGGHSGIYRVAYPGPDRHARAAWHVVRSAGTLEHTLEAPEPWEAWSRADWEPVAQRLGFEAYLRAVADPLRSPEQRVRAIEIMSRVHGGLPLREADLAARAPAPELRARAAWALGFNPVPGYTAALLMLARDAHPLVRRVALEVLLHRYLELENLPLAPVLRENLGHPDSRIRLLAARLATRLPDRQWEEARKGMGTDAFSLLGLALAEAWREPERAWHTNTLNLALNAWIASAAAGARLEALSLMLMAMGDQRAPQPGWDTFAGFTLAGSLSGHEAELRRLKLNLRPAFPSGDVVLDAELGRVLAMVGDDDPKLPRRLLDRITSATPAPLDFHYLAALARLPATRDPSLTAATASALTGMARKVGVLPPETWTAWQPRITELGRHLLARDPALAEALLRHPDFARPALAPLSFLMPEEHQTRAAARFLAAVQRDANFPCTPELIRLLALLPPEQTRAYFLRRWPQVEPARQWEITVQLARAPEATDRPVFQAGLEAEPYEVVEASLQALQRLPADASPGHLAALLRLLQRLTADPAQAGLRQKTLALINRQSGQKFSIQENQTAADAIAALYAPVQDWFKAAYPAVARRQDPLAGPLAALEQTLRATPWARGDAARGAARFERFCAECHRDPLRAPPLEGGAGRRPPLELFPHIAYPQWRVAPEYRLYEYQVRNRQKVVGRPLYEGMEVRLIQTTNGVVRLGAAEVVKVSPVQGSLMPEGLLRGWSPTDLADLWAFLRQDQGGR